MKAFELMGWVLWPDGHYTTPDGHMMVLLDGTLIPAGIVAIQDRLLGMGYEVRFCPPVEGKQPIALFYRVQDEAAFTGWRPETRHFPTLPAALEWACNEEKTG